MGWIMLTVAKSQNHTAVWSQFSRLNLMSDIVIQARLCADHVYISFLNLTLKHLVKEKDKKNK